MKKLLILLLFTPFFCFSQSKGDNTINLSYVEYDSVKFMLFKNGYNLNNNDSTYITTSPKTIKGTAIALKLLIYRTNNETFIKGLIKPVVSLELLGTKTDTEFSELYFGGGKNSPMRKTWNEMDRIAKLFSNNIGYLKQ